MIALSREYWPDDGFNSWNRKNRVEKCVPLPLSQRAKLVFKIAIGVKRLFRHRRITSAHLLMGCLSEEALDSVVQDNEKSLSLKVWLETNLGCDLDDLYSKFEKQMDVEDLSGYWETDNLSCLTGKNLLTSVRKLAKCKGRRIVRLMDCLSVVLCNPYSRAYQLLELCEVGSETIQDLVGIVID